MANYLKVILFSLCCVSVPALSTDLSSTIECPLRTKVWTSSYENYLHRNLHQGSFKVRYTSMSNYCSGQFNDPSLMEALRPVRDSYYQDVELGVATLFGNKGWVVTAYHVLYEGGFLELWKKGNGTFYIESDDKSECYQLKPAGPNISSPNPDIDLVLLKVEGLVGTSKLRYAPKIHFGYPRLASMAGELRGMGLKTVESELQHYLGTYAIANSAVSGALYAAYLPNQNIPDQGQPGHSGTVLFDSEGMAYAIYEGRYPEGLNSGPIVKFVPFYLIKDEVISELDKYFDADGFSEERLYSASNRVLNGILGENTGKASMLIGALLSKQEWFLSSPRSENIKKEIKDYIKANDLSKYLTEGVVLEDLKYRLKSFTKCIYGGQEEKQIGIFLDVLSGLNPAPRAEMPNLLAGGGIPLAAGNTYRRVPSDAREEVAEQGIMKLIDHISLSHAGAAMVQSSSDPKLKAALIRKGLSFDKLGERLAVKFKTKGDLGVKYSAVEVSKRLVSNVNSLVKIESEIAKDSSLAAQKSRELNARSVLDVANTFRTANRMNTGLAKSIEIYSQNAGRMLKGKLFKDIKKTEVNMGIAARMSSPRSSSFDFEMQPRVLERGIHIGPGFLPADIRAIEELNSFGGGVIMRDQ